MYSTPSIFYGHKYLPLEYINTLVQPYDNTLSINIWVYLTIFPPLAWLVILAMLMLVAMLLLISTKCYGDSTDFENISVTYSLHITFLYLIQLSDDKIKLFRSKPLKVALVTWAIGCYLVFSYYAATLTADMTTGPPESKIRYEAENNHHKIPLSCD